MDLHSLVAFFEATSNVSWFEKLSLLVALYAIVKQVVRSETRAMKTMIKEQVDQSLEDHILIFVHQRKGGVNETGT